MDKELLNKVVLYAMTYEKDHGLESLMKMGDVAPNGIVRFYSLTYEHKRMRFLIDKHLPLVLKEIGHEDLALRILRGRIIAALGG